MDGGIAASGTGAGWGSPLKTVTEALAIANPSACVNEIWVKAGTYYPMAGNAVAASRDSSFRILRDGIHLFGGFNGTEAYLSDRVPGYTTYLSGNIGAANDSTDNCYHVVTIITKPGAGISSLTGVGSFTITGGAADGTGTFTINGQVVSRRDGAGIYIYGAGTGTACNPVIGSCAITHNYADNGAAIYCNGDNGGTSNPRIDVCTLSINNAGLSGGAVYISATSGNSSPGFNFCNIINNNAALDGGGYRGQAPGGISNPFFNQCSFSNNAGSTGGGAISINATGGIAAATIFESTFADNKAQAAGGAVSILGGNLLATLSTFTGNTTSASGGAINMVNGTGRINESTFERNAALLGGAVRLSGGHVSVDACTFNACTSGQGGGALALRDNTVADTVTNSVFYACQDIGATASGGGGAMHFLNESVSVINNTFYADSAVANGGAVKLSGPSGTFRYYNNIFYKTKAANGNDVFTDPGSWSVSQSNNSASTINPQFIDESNPAGPNGYFGDTDDGLKLSPCSPAVNAGLNAAATFARDIDFQPRIQQSIVDLGAYESPYGLPAVNITANVPLASGICPGTAVTFTAAAVNAGASPAYQWKKNGINTGTNSATYTDNTLTNGDVITVVITPALGCVLPPVTSNALTIIVNSAPAAPTSIAGNRTPCAGTLQTYSTPATTGASSYTWTLPAGWSGFAATNSINVTAGTGSGTISVVAVNACGTSAPYSITVTPKTVPAAPTAISGNSTPCSGSQQAYSIAPLAGADSYNWKCSIGQRLGHRCRHCRNA